MKPTRSRTPLACLLGASLLAATFIASAPSGRTFLAGSQIAEAASVSDCTTHILQRGSSDQTCITALQHALNGAAWLQEDRQFGLATYYAVLSFQASKGLAVDGIAGPQTLRAASVANCPTMQRNSSGDCVRALQQALNRAAWLGEDGKFGPATYYAVLSFQASKGLAVDGIAGPQTLAALAGQPGPTPPQQPAPPAPAPPPTSTGPAFTVHCYVNCSVYLSRHVTREIANSVARYQNASTAAIAGVFTAACLPAGPAAVACTIAGAVYGGFAIDQFLYASSRNDCIRLRQPVPGIYDDHSKWCRN